MRRWQRVVGWTGLALLILVAAMWIFLLSPLPAEPAAAALAADRAQPCAEPCDLTLGPPSASTGVVLYVGARVDPDAYADVAVAVADAGYLVVIPELTINFAVFDQDAAIEVIDAHPEIDRWVVGGHSLGGAMAARAAADDPRIDGLILLAAYPESALDLSASDLAVVSIYASEDGLATPAEVLDAAPRLPADTRFIEIEGGNHAHFGAYGDQRGDNPATIPADVQHDAVADAVVDFLDQLP